ncbi:expressed unknown protein [Seminavis robusta]|uniref:Uncharacterized protein n=1 Tax=Seminavis robusta TaxID=568900 RepID=A0A9N8EW21_9STRA|nr:expressed unknown protein [Seminavis robusta]|eukprot:Sro1772_g296720.1 n/a (156) ;mRNA; r:18743-19210
MGNNSQSALANQQQHELQQRERAEAMLRELQELALEGERVEAVLPGEASGAYQAYYDSVCCKKWEPVLFGAYTTAGAAGCACIGGALLNPLTASVGGAVGMTVGAVEAASAISEIEKALKSSLPMPTMEEYRVKSKSFGNLAESVFSRKQASSYV